MADLLSASVTASYGGLLVGFALAFARLLRGPTLADRVVALDLIAFITIGFIAVYAIDNSKAAFIDVALTLALVAFLGTVAFARLIMGPDD